MEVAGLYAWAPLQSEQLRPRSALCSSHGRDVRCALDVVAKINSDDLCIAGVGDPAGDAGLEGQDGNKSNGKRTDDDGHDRHHDNQFNECEPLLASICALIRTGTLVPKVQPFRHVAATGFMRETLSGAAIGRELWAVRDRVARPFDRVAADPSSCL